MRRGISGLAIAWCIAVIVAITPFVIGMRLAPDLAGHVMAIDRLQKIHPGAVVFIGSSLTECGVPYDRQFSALAASTGLHLDFVRMTVPNATQEDFADVMDRILRSRAGTVLIEAHVLFRQPSRWQRRTDVSHWTHVYMEQVRALRVKLGLAAVNRSVNTGTADCSWLHKSATDGDIERLARNRRQMRTVPWLPSFRRLIQVGDNHGKRIVVVSLGRSRGLESRIDPTYRRQFGSALQKLRTGHKVEVWVFPSLRLPDDWYGDGAHLMVKGRMVFSHWLIRQLARRHAGN